MLGGELKYHTKKGNLAAKVHREDGIRQLAWVKGRARIEGRSEVRL